MRMVMIGGGLGNQISQYVFKRYIELNTGETCFFDDMPYFGIEEYAKHNGYELERVFGIQAKRVSSLLDLETRIEFINLMTVDPQTNRRTAVPVEIYQSCGLDLYLVQEGNFYSTDLLIDYCGEAYSYPVKRFCPEILSHRGGVYYYGYWYPRGWFESVEKTVRKELVFREPSDEVNRRLLKLVSQSDRSVAVHFRRGDFLQHGIEMQPELYCKAIDKVRRMVSHPVFFVFSDDIPWVKEHIFEYGFSPADEICFMGHNQGKNSYLDMYLMSCCRGIVLAQESTFSGMAARLSRREDLFVIDPSKPDEAPDSTW